MEVEEMRRVVVSLLEEHDSLTRPELRKMITNAGVKESLSSTFEAAMSTLCNKKVIEGWRKRAHSRDVGLRVEAKNAPIWEYRLVCR